MLLGPDSLLSSWRLLHRRCRGGLAFEGDIEVAPIVFFATLTLDKAV